MRIHGGYQNVSIMIAAQFSVNTATAVSRDMNGRSEDYEVTTKRKGHCRDFDGVSMTKFVATYF